MTTKTGQALQVRPFTSLPTLIPSFQDGVFTGRPYKAELVLMRSPEGGARQHVWFEADPRPHNHPWEYIDCKVLHGEYTAAEYILTNRGTYIEDRVTLQAGDPEHRVSHKDYHQVISVTPGTVTLMSFGPVVGDGKQWGNLVKEGPSYRPEPSSSPPGFLDALRHLNPHLRPDGWTDPYGHFPVPTVEGLMAGVGL